MHTVSKDAPGDDEEEDGVSEAASLEEPKEEDQGEGYLSEMDNEPPVSESDDGFSIHIYLGSFCTTCITSSSSCTYSLLMMTTK